MGAQGAHLGGAGMILLRILVGIVYLPIAVILELARRYR